MRRQINKKTLQYLINQQFDNFLEVEKAGFPYIAESTLEKYLGVGNAVLKQVELRPQRFGGRHTSNLYSILDYGKFTRKEAVDFIRESFLFAITPEQKAPLVEHITLDEDFSHFMKGVFNGAPILQKDFYSAEEVGMVLVMAANTLFKLDGKLSMANLETKTPTLSLSPYHVGPSPLSISFGGKSEVSDLKKEMMLQNMFERSFIEMESVFKQALPENEYSAFSGKIDRFKKSFQRNIRHKHPGYVAKNVEMLGRFLEHVMTHDFISLIERYADTFHCPKDLIAAFEVQSEHIFSPLYVLSNSLREIDPSSSDFIDERVSAYKKKLTRDYQTALLLEAINRSFSDSYNQSLKKDRQSHYPVNEARNLVEALATGNDLSRALISTAKYIARSLEFYVLSNDERAKEHGKEFTPPDQRVLDKISSPLETALAWASYARPELLDEMNSVLGRTYKSL